MMEVFGRLRNYQALLKVRRQNVDLAIEEKLMESMTNDRMKMIKLSPLID